MSHVLGDLKKKLAAGGLPADVHAEVSALVN